VVSVLAERPVGELTSAKRSANETSAVGAPNGGAEGPRGRTALADDESIPDAKVPTWELEVDPYSSTGEVASAETEVLPPATAPTSESAGKFSGSLKGLLLLNLGAALFGSNQVAIKAAEATCPPGLLSAVRFATAAICFAPSTLKGLRDPQVRAAAMELGLYLTGGYIGQAFGLTQTTATHGALTGTFTVIAVPMYVGLSGGKVSLTTWLSAMVAIFGVGLLTTDGSVPNVGDAWCILSALIFGLHKFRSESVTREMPDKTKELMASQLSVLALGSMAAAAVEIQMGGQGMQHALELVSNLPLPNLIYMGVATTALTLWIEMESLKEVSAPLAALIYTTEPLWGAGFAYFLIGDRWGPQGWLGGGCIVAASLFSQILEASSEKEKQA